MDSGGSIVEKSFFYPELAKLDWGCQVLFCCHVGRSTEYTKRKPEGGPI